MKYLIPLLLLLSACAKSGGGGSASAATAIRATPNNASDLSGTYSLQYLSCDQGISVYTSTVGDSHYNETITINGSNYSETESNSDCSGTYEGSISLDSNGMTNTQLVVSSVSSGISCDIAKYNGMLTIFDNMALGNNFGSVNTVNYILDSGTLSIQDIFSQKYGNINGWTNCWDVYSIN